MKENFYPLKNLIFCLNCSNKIMPCSKNNYRYYRCRGYNKGVCSPISFKADALENQISQKIQRQISNKQKLENVFWKLYEKEFQELENKKAELTRELRHAREIYSGQQLLFNASPHKYSRSKKSKQKISSLLKKLSRIEKEERKLQKKTEWFTTLKNLQEGMRDGYINKYLEKYYMEMNLVVLCDKAKKSFYVVWFGVLDETKKEENKNI